MNVNLTSLTDEEIITLVQSSMDSGVVARELAKRLGEALDEIEDFKMEVACFGAGCMEDE